MRALVFLLGVLLLSGCDKLTGVADQKIADAEAIGFACRVSHKTPEECMKENEAQSPSSVLDGWKSADEDIKAGKLDPKMSGKASEPAAEDAAADGEKKLEGDKPAEGADIKEDKKDGTPEADAAKKPAEAAHDKPAH